MDSWEIKLNNVFERVLADDKEEMLTTDEFDLSEGTLSSRENRDIARRMHAQEDGRVYAEMCELLDSTLQLTVHTILNCHDSPSDADADTNVVATDEDKNSSSLHANYHNNALLSTLASQEEEDDGMCMMTCCNEADTDDSNNWKEEDTLVFPSSTSFSPSSPPLALVAIEVCLLKVLWILLCYFITHMFILMITLYIATPGIHGHGERPPL